MNKKDHKMLCLNKNNMGSSLVIKVFLCIILLGFGLGFALPVMAAVPKQVLVLDIPGLMIEEMLKASPAFKELVSSGAGGLVTLPNLPFKKTSDFYLALNTTRSLKAPDEALLFFESDEEYQGMTAGALYRSFTGWEAPVNGGVNLGIAKLLQTKGVNADQVGLLGTILQRHGFTTAVIGNADLNEAKINRPSGLLLMNQQGSVKYASVSTGILIRDDQAVWGISTNLAQVMVKLEQLQDQRAVFHIILGDLERIHKFSPYLSQVRAEKHRLRVIHAYDGFFEELMKRLDFDRTLLVVLATTPPNEIKNEMRLYPVVMKNNHLGSGELYSDSTRCPGLITGYDLIATILEFLDINSQVEYSQGRKLHVVDEIQQDLQETNRKLSRNYNLRWPLLTFYAYLLIALVVIMILGLIIGTEKWLTFLKYAENLHLFLLAIPAVFLVEALIDPVTWPVIIMFSLIGASLITMFALKLARGDQLKALAIICLITVILVILDGMGNGYAQLRSFWGYSAVVGARFYGIGNEYMGFLLGAYIVMLAIVLPNNLCWKQQILWLSAVLLALFLAHPNFGANIGGGITAWLGLGVTNYFFLKRPVGWRELLKLVLGLLLMLAFIGYWDLSMAGQATHFGRFIETVREKGCSTLLQMMLGKLELNLHLIQYTPLAKLLLVILLVIPVLSKRPPQCFSRLAQEQRQIVKGIQGLSFTAFVALLFNDSGIVSVATMFIFGLNLFFLLLFKERLCQGADPS